MTTAILQARMGSSRLPGKMLLPVHGEKGALQLMLERVAVARTLDRVIVATTTLPEDAAIVELCDALDVRCFRGDPQDVLDRYTQCARTVPGETTFVRLTGDCPLHDPDVIDQVVTYFLAGGFDYASNAHPPSYPDGLDTEVFTRDALEKAWRDATLVSEREHVTYHLYTHPERFRIGNHVAPVDRSALRWTLDEPADLQFMRAVYSHLGNRATAFRMDDVVRLLASHPDLLAINQDIGRNEGLLKSLQEDRRLGNIT